ncbi:MAG: SOS response-associated peptidase family protein, partial [Erysipelotrichaceae bacterium]|nr:SOS response-associated peptidase family protein [Erysipelotrichaceae bacterium]MDD4643315.1 SOS response-associated peptidase family protein [Erysipelotrichaceae bacterium]
MCGRYLFNDNSSQAIAKIIDQTKQKYEQAQLDLVVWEEIYPSAYSVVMLCEKGKLTPTLMNWGFLKKNSKELIINARIENIKSNSFKSDYQNNRCVVACTGFYEWDKDKKRHFIKNPNEDIIYLAAIYRKIEDKYYYNILTKRATKQLLPIHERMPIVMNKEDAIKYCEC